MSMDNMVELRKRRGFIDRSNEANELVEAGRNLIKFNLQKIEDLDATNGEGVWGYLNDEDYALWKDDNYTGTVNAILLNWPFTWNVLFWGQEVKLRCHGEHRPTLDPDWVRENILNTDWYKKYSEGLCLCVADWILDGGTLICKAGKDYKIVGGSEPYEDLCDICDCEDGSRRISFWSDVDEHFRFY